MLPYPNKSSVWATGLRYESVFLSQEFQYLFYTFFIAAIRPELITRRMCFASPLVRTDGWREIKVSKSVCLSYISKIDPQNSLLFDVLNIPPTIFVLDYQWIHPSHLCKMVISARTIRHFGISYNILEYTLNINRIRNSNNNIPLLFGQKPGY